MYFIVTMRMKVCVVMKNTMYKSDSEYVQSNDDTYYWHT